MCDTCEELREEIRQLRQAFLHSDYIIPEEYNFTRTEASIFSLLKKRSGYVVRYSALHVASREFGRCDGADPMKIVNVHIHKIRSKLKAANGPNIANVWGIGYKLEV